MAIEMLPTDQAAPDARQTVMESNPILKFAAGRAHFVRIIHVLLVLVFLWPLPAGAADKEKLSPRYRKWLDEEVVYIISKDERDVFLKLTRDDDRDKFIEQFWDARNPAPGAPTNAYKEEHYRRIEYANKHFTIGSGTDGWRTERGRIYIQLGEPAQRQQVIWHGRIRPSELWFYSNTQNPSLPGFFNILFYQRDEVGDYRLYSPYLDGPTRLVRGADTPEQAYQLLRQNNLELARASLTLLTDEPADIDNFKPSLTSDALLSRIGNLPNDRFTKEKIARNAELRGTVKSRLLLETQSLQVIAEPFLNPEGETFVHYFAKLPKTVEQLSVFDKDKGQHSLSLEVTVTVRTPQGRQLFQQSYSQIFTFNPQQFEQQRLLHVAYEDRLPLPSGTYDLGFVVFDAVHRDYALARQTVTVPDTTSGLKLGPIIPYDEAIKMPPGEADAPFQFFNIRFVPSARREFGQGERLSVFFQMFLPNVNPASSPDAKLQVEYTLGSLAGGDRQTLTDELARNQADAHGALLHGKQFPLADLPPGNYRLLIKVTDPVTKQTDAQTFPFRLAPVALRTPAVTFVNPQYLQERQDGWLDYRRGLGWDAQNHVDLAIKAFHSALAKNPNLEPARDHLAALYFRASRYSDVVGLFSPSEMNPRTDPQAAGVLMASLERLGHLDKAIETGEKAVTILGASETLYEQLATLYERAGQPGPAQRARDEALKIRQNPTKSEPLAKP